ncbi:MAG: LysR family transcriptional regulator [Beijerinckiaceae bacterium]
MNLRQLLYFVNVVDAGNMTRAAERLHVAQTALGMQIKQIEDELGVALLVRHSRGVEATKAGAKLYERANEILALVETTKADVANCGQHEKQIIRFGITPALMLSSGADLALNIRDALPLAELSIVEAMSHMLIEALSREELDCILCYDVPAAPSLNRIALLQDDLVLVSAPGAQAAGPIDLAEVLKLPLAMPEAGDSIRATTNRAALDLGLQMNVAYEVRSITAMKGLAARGVASCILPYFSVAEDVAKGALAARPIARPALRRTLFLASSKLAHPIRQETELLGAVRSSLGGLIGTLGALGHPMWSGD